MAKQGDGNTKKGGKTGIVIGVVAVVVIAILIGIIAYLLRGRDEPEPAPEPEQEQTSESEPEQDRQVAGQRNVLVTEDNVDEIMAQEPEPVTEAGRYTVTMNTYWNFPDGRSESNNAYVGNSTDNSHDVYFDIVANESGETIYESPIIPVGSAISNIRLDKELENGIYDCVMTYHLIDGDQNTLSTVDVALTVNIGNASPLDELNE